MLPFELLNLVMSHLTRAERSHLSQVSRCYRNTYYQHLSLQAQEILNRMGHYLIGVSLSELVQHLTQAQVTVTRSEAQREKEISNTVDFIEYPRHYHLVQTTTIKNLRRITIEAKKEGNISIIVNAVAPPGINYILPEVIPLRFYLDNTHQVLILDVFGNLYRNGNLLLSRVKEVFAREQVTLILTLSGKLYILFVAKLRKMKRKQPYVHLTMNGALTAQGEFYEIGMARDQQPWLDQPRKITQIYFVERFLRNTRYEMRQDWKFYIDDQEKLYLVKHFYASKITKETLIASDVKKIGVNYDSDFLLLLVVLANDGSIHINQYVSTTGIVSTIKIPLSWKGVDLIDDKRNVYIMASDLLVTVKYIDGKIQFNEEKRCVCPPIDRYYQTYRCN